MYTKDKVLQRVLLNEGADSDIVQSQVIITSV
jgi:hypothetical protein